jgi:hypothetical protein
MTKPTLAELGNALGLARSTVAALKARGMPVDSLEAARAWRAAHIDAAFAKENRCAREDRAAVVSRLGLRAHDDLGRYGEDLREAYCALPRQAQDRVQFSTRVWDYLVAHALPPLEPHMKAESHDDTTDPQQ